MKVRNPRSCCGDDSGEAGVITSDFDNWGGTESACCDSGSDCVQYSTDECRSIGQRKSSDYSQICDSGNYWRTCTSGFTDNHGQSVQGWCCTGTSSGWRQNPSEDQYSCSDGIDNDCDEAGGAFGGGTDCGDNDCVGQTGPGGATCCASNADCSGSDICNQQTDQCEPPPCDPSESNCGDGIDNDCDGDTDCADSDCSTSSSCEDSTPPTLPVPTGPSGCVGPGFSFTWTASSDPESGVRQYNPQWFRDSCLNTAGANSNGNTYTTSTSWSPSMANINLGRDIYWRVAAQNNDLYWSSFNPSGCTSFKFGIPIGSSGCSDDSDCCSGSCVSGSCYDASDASCNNCKACGSSLCNIGPCGGCYDDGSQCILDGTVGSGCIGVSNCGPSCWSTSCIGFSAGCLISDQTCCNTFLYGEQGNWCTGSVSIY